VLIGLGGLPAELAEALRVRRFPRS
jgi:hypothetical protein